MSMSSCHRLFQLLILHLIIERAGCFLLSPGRVGSKRWQSASRVDACSRLSRARAPIPLLQSARSVLLDVESAPDSVSARADKLFAQSVDVYANVVSQDRQAEWDVAARDDSLVKAMHLLEEVFRLDFEVVKASYYSNDDVSANLRSCMNVTCMRPAGGTHDDSRRPFIMGEELLGMELEPGRLCESGTCSDTCSRVQLSRLASSGECDEVISRVSSLMPPLLEGADAQQASPRQQHNLPLQFTAAAGDLRLHLLYLRLVERMRRVVALEYGLELSSISLTNRCKCDAMCCK